MLTPLDDTLWHQLPTTFDHVGTSDPRFFDRYWFACNAPDGSAAVQLTLGAYRNMNVVDAAVVVTHGGKQHNVRASRSLGSRMVPECGPIRVEVLEPLQEFRLTISDSTGSVTGELVWRGIVPPHEEQPHFERHRGRVREDYQRFDQIGCASGWLEVGGTRILVENWWACRDHSWGVRPRIGVREPITGPKEALARQGFVMAFLFFSTDRHAGHTLFMQRGQEPAYTTGVLGHQDGSPPHVVGDVALDADLHEGTRRFRTAVLTVTDSDGQKRDLTVTALGSAIAMQGLGYSGGYDDGAGLGVWRGEDHLEHEVWDVSHPARIVDRLGDVKEHWHRIQPVAVAGDFGRGPETGFGSMTLLLSGHLPHLGLSTAAP